MANGNSKFDLRECEAFFEPIAGTMNRFAALRNLVIAKYDHESPSWDFCFAHPIGGFGRISLIKSESGALQLSATVWMDEYDRFVRWVRMSAPRTVERDDELLLRELSGELDRVLTWTLDGQFQTYGSYEQHWGSLTKHQFLASQPVFPVPRG